MKFPCRLEGGPFDGDQGSWVDREELPERFWAHPCPDTFCRFGGIHWVTQPVRRGELYVYDRMEEKGGMHVAVYVHGDVDLHGLPTIREHEIVPA